jgi:hypothetical protein
LLGTKTGVELIQEHLIIISKKFVEEKKALHMPSELQIESWLTSLLEEVLKDDFIKCMNIERYIRCILDDVEKCEFFTTIHSKNDIVKFLHTLII